MQKREIELLKFSGARVVRIIDGAHAAVDEHAHDWPVLSIFVLGSCDNRSAVGDHAISSPSAVFYRAGAEHANRVGRYGYEQIQMELDPRWLRSIDTNRIDPTRHWVGGQVATAARALASLWNSPDAAETTVAKATEEFLRFALHHRNTKRPPWLNHVVQSLHSDAVPTTRQLARELGMHAGWLAEAYRGATGEGLQETVRRRRVAIAASLLRQSSRSPADIAAAAGFCDQSHMIRSLRALLGRTPTQIRSEWTALHQASNQRLHVL
ncbi:MAG TPA: AraC family transcriptional regulator [Thermoanaerobaculia bacterium]|nr:AraC family transcriptional regulator [Thermoanaerobaculia bacterium]